MENSPSSRPIPKRRSREPEPKKSHWQWVLGTALVVGVVADLTLFALQTGLPKSQEVLDQKDPQSTWVVTADGTILGELYEVRRRTVYGSQLNDYVRHAFVAAHDPLFETRSALSLSDIFKAYTRPGPKADGNPGGLTVPLAYTSLQPAHTKFDRMRAWLLARRLESELSKHDIETLYLNRVDLGSGVFGVEEGALFFFSKHANELTLAEAALLASIAPRPTSRSPLGFPELAQKRRDTVIDAMLTQGFIKADEADEAKGTAIKLKLFHAAASPLLSTVRQVLRKQLGREKLSKGGFTVDLSVDMAQQLQLQKALKAAVAQAEAQLGPAARGQINAAGLIIQASTGYVLAHVGNMLPGGSLYDRVTHLQRPVGAAFAPFVYGMMIDANEDFMAAAQLDRIEDMDPHGWDGDTADLKAEKAARDRDPITAFEAFATHDVGGHAVLLQKLGYPAVSAKAASLGFNPKKRGLANGPSGSPWTLAMAWTSLTNEGAPVSLELIDHMTNPDAKMVPLTPSAAPPSLMKPAAASLLRYWLADARETEGLASAGHVGTDSFAAGLQGNLVAAIWVGPEKEGNTLGTLQAGPAMKALKAVLGGEPRTEMPVSNVEQGLIDRSNGQLARTNDGLKAPFLTGTEPGPSTAPSRPQKHKRR